MNQLIPDIDNYENTWRDYTNDCYRVYFEIGGGTEYGLPIIEKFVTDWVQQERVVDPEFGRNIAVRAALNGFEADVPMQKIPEIVRELAAANVAIYQIVRTGTRLAAGEGKAAR